MSKIVTEYTAGGSKPADYHQLAGDIDRRLIWRRTPQGHDYWSTVCDNLRRIADELESFETKPKRNFTELKVGGKYKTRAGDVVEIIENDGHHKWPFCGNNECSYTPQGYENSDSTPSNNDLIEEITTTEVDFKMQVEVNGKKYKLVEVK